MIAVGPPAGLYTHFPAAYTSGSEVFTDSAIRNMLVTTGMLPSKDHPTMEPYELSVRSYIDEGEAEKLNSILSLMSG
jgi:hypothetical protein